MDNDREQLLKSLYSLDKKQRKVVKVMGLPERVQDWTPEVIRSIYDRWEQQQQSGFDGAGIIEADAQTAGVSHQIAHTVHDKIATIHMWQEHEASHKT